MSFLTGLMCHGRAVKSKEGIPLFLISRVGVRVPVLIRVSLIPPSHDLVLTTPSEKCSLVARRCYSHYHSTTTIPARSLLIAHITIVLHQDYTFQNVVRTNSVGVLSKPSNTYCYIERELTPVFLAVADECTTAPCKPLYGAT